MPATTVQATDVVLQLTDDLEGATPDWLTIVCEIDSSTDHAVNVTETKTKCGTFTAVDTPTNSVSGNGAVNGTPEANQVSYKQLLSWLNNKTGLRGRYLNLADGVLDDGEAIYMEGPGRLSSLGSSNTEGDLLKFSYAFTFNGVPALEPES